LELPPDILNTEVLLPVTAIKAPQNVTSHMAVRGNYT
jgi:hypothetical protein